MKVQQQQQFMLVVWFWGYLFLTLIRSIVTHHRGVCRVMRRMGMFIEFCMVNYRRRLRVVSLTQIASISSVMVIYEHCILVMFLKLDEKELLQLRNNVVNVLNWVVVVCLYDHSIRSFWSRQYFKISATCSEIRIGLFGRRYVIAIRKEKRQAVIGGCFSLVLCFLGRELLFDLFMGIPSTVNDLFLLSISRITNPFEFVLEKQEVYTLVVAKLYAVAIFGLLYMQHFIRFNRRVVRTGLSFEFINFYCC